MSTTMSPPAPSSGIRTFHHGDFDTERLLDAKGATTASICLPARNEAATVGEIVRTLRSELLERGVVDEIVVLDDHSSDATAEVAAAEGARVAHAEDVLAEYGDGHGKGEALWKSLHVATGDLVLWCDSDISDFGARFVTGLLGPLLCEPDVQFVKGFYRRPEREGEGGGRVTELVARPLLSLYFPALAALHQPLSGEYGGRRELLERLPFACGYGVDIGLLIDLLDVVGVDSIAQVDLDVRHHRNRSLSELGPQAVSVLQTVLRRIDPALAPSAVELVRPGEADLAVETAERPPMIEVDAYAARRASSRAG